MNTPAHLVMGMAAFGRPGATAVTIAALVGSLAPDLSLYLLAGWEIAVLGTDPQVVFRERYFSALWQGIFAVDNSFVVWGGLLALGLLLRRGWLAVLGGAAVLHLVFDFALHNDDARRHLWPLTDWTFVSPVSYWDGDHYGGIVGPIEIALTLGLCALLWSRFRSRRARGLVAALAVAEAAPLIMWSLMLG